MKKIYFAIAILAYCLLVGTTGKTQTTLKVPRLVDLSFKSHFKNTAPLAWKKIKDVYVATTIVDKKDRVEAFFQEEGEFKGTGRYIPASSLPENIQGYVKNRFSDYNIKEAYEYKCNEEGLCYFLDMISSKHNLILRLSPDAQVLFSTKKKIKNPETGLAKHSKN